MKSTLNTILVAYTEAFISVIPYVILMATIILLSNILPILHIDAPLLNEKSLVLARTVLAEFFYFVLMIAIAFQLARRYAVSQTIVIFQSIAIFISTEALAHSQSGLDVILSSKSPFLVLIIPFMVVITVNYFTPAKTTYQYISTELNTSLRYIYSGIITFLLIVGILLVFEGLLEVVLDSGILRLDLPNISLMVIRTLLINFFFWFGLHGSHVYDSAFGTDLLGEYIHPGITFKQFYDIFVVYGGAGATLSLIIAVFVAGKDQHSKRIIKLAFPFAVFNINEVLVYGLPIIFNRKLFVPFMLVPLVNTVLAYVFLSIFNIQTAATDISWITPVFINSYIIAQGNLVAPALQAFLLALGTVIYIPFVRRYALEQSTSYQSQRLSEQLDVPVQLKSGQDVETQKEKQSIILNNEEVDKTITLLETATLLIYYQPKVNIQQNTCRQFEALLRIRMTDGEVRGPFFLEPLEKAGLAPIIDLWVCQQVDKHLRDWKTTPLPEISINLHPDTLARSDVIEKIISIHKGNPINFEIIERGLLNNPSALKNIKQLKAHGFKISIDDFGTGVSSLENLCHMPVDTLKIDKSLADLIVTPEGYVVCKNIVTLCEDMDFECVIEGVEHEKQVQAASRLGIPLVQGFYFSPAIAKAEAETFTPDARQASVTGAAKFQAR